MPSYMLLLHQPFLPTAEAEFLRALGRIDDAAACFSRAYELARTDPEQRFIGRKLAELGAAPCGDPVLRPP